MVAAHRLADVTLVADARMVSAANKKAIEDAGLSFILGARISEIPYVVAKWGRDHPGVEIADGQVFTQPWPAVPLETTTPRCFGPITSECPPRRSTDARCSNT
jgi:hypothetical protein